MVVNILNNKMLICIVSKLKCITLNYYDSRQVIGLNFLLFLGSLYDKLALFKYLFIWLCLVLDEARGIFNLHCSIILACGIF